MLPWLLAAWIAGASADAVTTTQAIGRGGHEAWIPAQQPWAIDAVVGGSTAFGLYAAHNLWTTGHRRTAILVTGLAVGVHGAAAIHNARVR